MGINPTKDLVYFLANEKVPYYFALESPSSSHKTGWAMDCAMGVVFDSLEEPTVVLIELIRTNGRVKGKGAATWLIDALLRYCKENQVDVFVTSTTEAVSFWKRFTFVKDRNEDLDEAWNDYGDCTLMRLPSNKAPTYSIDGRRVDFSKDEFEYISSDDDYVYYYEYL